MLPEDAQDLADERRRRSETDLLAALPVGMPEGDERVVQQIVPHVPSYWYFRKPRSIATSRKHCRQTCRPERRTIPRLRSLRRHPTFLPNSFFGFMPTPRR